MGYDLDLGLGNTADLHLTVPVINHELTPPCKLQCRQWWEMTVFII